MKIKLKAITFMVIALCAMNASWAEDSSSSDYFPAQPTHNPNDVILLAQGYIDSPSAPNQEQQTFTVNKTCPPHFNPYVVIRMSKMANQGTDHMIEGYGACVNGLNQTNDGYKIDYIVARQYAALATSDNSGRYVSDSSWVYTKFNTHPMPPTTYVSGMSQDPNGGGGFYWDLYCYPQGQKPPVNEAAPSGDPTSPSANGCAVGSGPY